jgi:hypothetical protein
LLSGYARVCNRRQHDKERADDIGLCVGAAAFESLPPTTLQSVFLPVVGLLLMAIGGFSGVRNFVFNGPRPQGIVAATKLVTESIRFFYGPTMVHEYHEGPKAGENFKKREYVHLG